MARRNRSTAVPGTHASQQGHALQALRLGLATAVLALAGCGGGGGSDPRPTALGVVQMTVLDTYGTPVAGATVAGPQGTSSTDAQGVTLVLVAAPGASAQVTVSRDSFVDLAATATSLPDQVHAVEVVLQRETLAAGGSLSSRSGVLPTLDATGQRLSFEVELVVVDGDARPIETLTAADFVLRPCVPDPGTALADCVRGADVGHDAAYTPATPAPEAVARVPGSGVRPYASALLLDQSGSILQSDPTGARLFSAKAFLDRLAGEDQALLAAFADGPLALLPSRPLTVYGPFREPAQARSYFPTIDALAPLVGGDTPLYDSIDALQQQWLGAGSLPTALGKALVVFTDGADTRCADPQACQARRQQTVLRAQQDQVRIITVGLSRNVDIAALGELANQTGGVLLYADHAAQLLPLYGSLGRMMSLSQTTYRLRWTVRTDVAGGFRPGHALLGRVQVNTESDVFDVPFVVGIP